MTSSGRRKRASATGQKGALGETFVKGAFEEMGWGPVPVSEHDTGSDFFVQVRDQELTELGLLVGIQVKNEAKYFSTEVSAKAKVAGLWEYKAEQDDAEYWLDHAIPHLLVLYDQRTKVAYWGHVRKETVRWTSKGARIQVPYDNVLDPSRREQLLSIAAESRRNIAWSPDTWTGLASVAPTRRLRTALLAPRVAARSGASSQDQILPETAIARLVLGRFPGRPGRGKSRTPSEAEQLGGPFAWRLHHAFWQYLKAGEPDALEALATGAAEAHERVALLAIRAAFAFERGDPRAALSVLDAADETDSVDPVDRAWLDAHRSRCLFELGDAETARELALAVAASGLLHAQDHGAVALRAAVLNSMLTADAPPADLQLAVAAANSPSVWWRDQHRAWALAEVLDRTFKEWASRASVDPRPDTDAWDRLRGVALSAGLNADHRAWCVAASELARYELSSGDLSETERVTSCLEELRNCGDKDALSQAVSHLILEGPIEPLRKLTHEIYADAATRTNLASTLVLIMGALEILDERTLDRHARWTLYQLQHPDEFATADQSFSWIAHDYFLPTLGDAYRLVTGASQALIRQHLVSMRPINHQLLAESYATLTRSIPPDDWTEDERERLRPRAEPLPMNSDVEVTMFGDHHSIGRAFNAVLAHGGESERLVALHEQLAAGNWQVLGDVGDIGAIPEVIVRQLIPHLIQDLGGRAEEAARGRFAHPYIYSGEVLLIINLLHPELAQWGPIQRALEGSDGRWDQAILARRLSREADRIDEGVIRRLQPTLVKLAADPDDRPLFDPRTGDAARTALLELTTRIDDPESLHAALASGPPGRKAVARAIGRHRRPSDLALLTALATHPDPYVRATTAGASATWLQHSPQPFVQALLASLLDEGGYATMRAIKHQQHNQVVHSILEKLSEHPSARIRWRAKELLHHPENCRC